MLGVSTDNSKQDQIVRQPVERFASTQWSLVLTAKRGSSPSAEQALASLCAAYWPPLYAYLRRRGYDISDAQDLTQSFFARLLEKNYLEAVRSERGRFRSFLLAALKHFLANEWDRERAQKRGGGRQIISIEEISSAEGSYRLDDRAHMLTPEKLFERRWALTLLNQTISSLGTEYERAGKGDLFEQLKSFLTGSDDGVHYSQVAAELKMSEGAVKTAVHRLRRRFRTLLRERIAQTVAHPEEPSEVDYEIRYLLKALDP